MHTPDLWAQDERFLRSKIRQLALAHQQGSLQEDLFNARWLVSSPRYALDLNQDGKEEALAFIKRDTQDWFLLFAQNQTELFRLRLRKLGEGSSLQRVRLLSLNKKKNLLVLYYAQGFLRSTSMSGQTVAYLVTFNKDGPKDFQSREGPLLHYESLHPRGSAKELSLQLTPQDLNHDGTIELLIRRDQEVREIYTYNDDQGWLIF